MFKIKPIFFPISIIELQKLFNLKVHIATCLVVVNNVGSTIDLEQQNYLSTYYQPNVGNMTIDETPTKDHMKDLHIANWIVIEEKPFQKINLGTSKVP